MAMRYLTGVNGDDGSAYSADDSLLEPMPIPLKPAVRVPRSAKREYTDTEIQCAARMMDLLHRGDDRRTLADRHPDAVLDVVVDRILRAIRD